MQGVDATVVVTVVQGAVWMSISPPFIREAIMEPGKVEEVMHVLEVARDEAMDMVAARNAHASDESKTVFREITTRGSTT